MRAGISLRTSIFLHCMKNLSCCSVCDLLKPDDNIEPFIIIFRMTDLEALLSGPSGVIGHTEEGRHPTREENFGSLFRF